MLLSTRVALLGGLLAIAACSGSTTNAPAVHPPPPAHATTPTSTLQFPAARDSNTAAPPALPAPEGERAEAKAHPYQAPVPALGRSAPASRYANMAPEQCRHELQRRKLPVKTERRMARGVANAVRVSGHFNEVLIRKPASPSPFGVLDCRLALALDDLTKVLAEFGIGHIHIGSIYRKGARIVHRGTRSQHASGLAMDVLSMRHRDGRMLNVERDWHASVGETACGVDAVMHEPNPSAILLRNVVCEVARRQIFHVVLTPSANRAHVDHLHLDIKRREDELTLR